MSQTPNPTAIYYGKREDVIRELGGMTHIYPGKYLIQLDGGATYDAEGADNLKDARAFVRELRALYPHATIHQL